VTEAFSVLTKYSYLHLLLVCVMTSASGGILITAIGSGSYWAELAVARPLFTPLGHAYLPISGPPTFEPHLNITYYVECHLHSHYNVLTSTGIENGIVC